MNIGKFLEQQGQQGQFDSSDGFTLDALRARVKLGQSQLPNPGLWLVKMVQTAVAMNAPRVDIKMGRRRVDIEFEAIGGPTGQELLTGVFSGVLSKERALSHLLTGLRAATSGHTENLSWTVDRAGRRTRVEINEGQGQVEEHELVEPAPGTLTRYRFQVRRPARHIGWRKLWDQPLTGVLKNLVEEMSEITTRCWCSPIPIFLDGRELERGLPCDRMWDIPDLNAGGGKVNRNESVDHRLAVFGLALDNAPRLHDIPVTLRTNCEPERTADGVLRYPPQGGHKSLYLYKPRQEENSYLYMSVTKFTRSAITFVQDGAVVDHLPVTLGRWVLDKPGLSRATLAFQLFRAVEAEELDLSHFQVRRRQEVLRETLEHAGPALSNVIDRLMTEVNSCRPGLVQTFRRASLPIKALFVATAPLAVPSFYLQEGHLRFTVNRHGKMMKESLQT